MIISLLITASTHISDTRGQLVQLVSYQSFANLVLSFVLILQKAYCVGYKKAN